MLSNDWRSLFNVERIEPEFHINVDHGECDANCLMAKELKCVCRCGGRNHGASLRNHVKPLTEFVEFARLNDYSMVY